jgi:hypothetical protein
MSTVLLLCEPSRADVYRSVLSPRGHVVEAAASFAEAGRVLRKGAALVVFWVLEQPSKTLEVAQTLAGLDDPLLGDHRIRVVALTQTRDPAHLRAALETKAVTALLALDDAGNPDPGDLLVTVSQLTAPRVLHARSYLANPQVQRSIDLTRSADKKAALDLVTQVAGEIGCNPYVTSTVVTTAEEMILNAFYHGPVNASGASRYSGRPRSEAIELLDHERVTMSVAADDERLCVSVVDRFGSLQVTPLARRLASCLEPRGAELSRDYEGAGIGLLMALRDMHCLIFNVIPGRATEVVALVRRTKSFREFRIHPKSFAFFCGGGSGDCVGA